MKTDMGGFLIWASILLTIGFYLAIFGKTKKPSKKR